MCFVGVEGGSMGLIIILIQDAFQLFETRKTYIRASLDHAAKLGFVKASVDNLLHEQVREQNLIRGS